MDPWKVGSLTVYPYGTVISLAALAALFWTSRRMRGAGLKSGVSGWFALLAVPLSFLFARLAYCVMILDHLLGSGLEAAFQVTNGGFLLWGAVGGVLLAALLTGKITGESVGSILDAVVLPACLLIAVGRLAAGLLIPDLGTGMDLESWFAPWETDPAARYSLCALEDYEFFERFPFAVQNYYEEWCWAVFVPEAIWAALCGLVSFRKVCRPGGRASFALLLLFCGQIPLEAMLWGTVIHLPWLGFVRGNQVLCAIGVVALWLHFSRSLPVNSRMRSSLPALIQIIFAALIVTAMEFAAFEKKITLIEWVPADICLVIMSLACLWMVLALLPLWNRKFR